MVVFEIGEEHVFELFEMHICARAGGVVERRGGIRVRDVFSSEERNVSVSTVHIFF